MSNISVDVEADGTIPGDYSMVSIGAVLIEPSLKETFYGQLKPISDKFVPEALAVSGHSREETLSFEEPIEVMEKFSDWIGKVSQGRGRPIFWSDNNGFDWMFVCYYFHHFLGHNPFGWSSRRIGDLYCGLTRDGFAKWRHLRKTKHTHHPVDDAKGNAEALLAMQSKFNLKLGMV